METKAPPIGSASSGVAREELRPDENVNDTEPSYRTSGIILALLPVASFVAQYLLSVRAGTQRALFHHLTVMVVDWTFIPFNFSVVRVIDWREGKKLYFIFCISAVLNALTHAYWQYNGLDLGHMITPEGIVLPAGWVHLTFSTLEMVLLVAFIFCRHQQAPGLRLPTAFATIYFITMGTCGYLMHRGFIASDLIVFTSGLFFVLVYPGLIQKKRLRRSISR
ncbi:MAG TPA: hypothetical protein VIK39_16145 [Candidatus Angelobacter sp.]|jgi:hypothetical protein